MKQAIHLPFYTQIVFISLLFINILSLTGTSYQPTGRTIVPYVLYLILAWFVVSVLRGRVVSHMSVSLLIYILLYLAALFISSLINDHFSLELFIQVSAVFVWIILSSHTTWDRLALIYGGWLHVIFISFLAFDYIFQLTERHPEGLTSIFRNPNGLAIVLFVTMYFALSAIYQAKHLVLKLTFSLSVILTLVFILLTKSRSVYLSVALLAFTFLVYFLKEKWLPYLFGVFMSLFSLFFFAYLYLPGTAFGNWLNDLSRELTTKNFFSGREVIWSNLMDYILQSPVYGHGITLFTGDLPGVNNSAHSQYLQTLLESGFIGFILFIVILYQIWRLLLKNKDHFQGLLSSGYLIATLIYAGFELTMFQNNFTIGLFQWTIFTIGLSLIPKRERHDPSSRVRARRQSSSSARYRITKRGKVYGRHQTNTDK